MLHCSHNLFMRAHLRLVQIWAII